MKKVTLPVLLIVPLISLLLSCNSNSKQKIRQEKETLDIQEKVDLQGGILKSSISEFDFILNIDHSRLAKEAGVYTPPSIAYLFSNPKVNSELIRIKPLIGLDLPYKILCYSEPDTTTFSIAFTSSAFIQKRHGLKEDNLKAYKEDMENVLSKFPKSQIQNINIEKVNHNYGIILLNSEFNFDNTIQRLKNTINAQSDTKWFGEIDFQKDAEELSIKVGKTTLLLFGGPAPGGMAMVDSPRLGLDAFCQKLLVFENDEKQVIVAFNDIPAFADLYYNRSTKPQENINARLKTVFENALFNN